MFPIVLPSLPQISSSRGEGFTAGSESLQLLSLPFSKALLIRQPSKTKIAQSRPGGLRTQAQGRGRGRRTRRPGASGDLLALRTPPLAAVVARSGQSVGSSCQRDWASSGLQAFQESGAARVAGRPLPRFLETPSDGRSSAASFLLPASFNSLAGRTLVGDSPITTARFRTAAAPRPLC